MSDITSFDESSGMSTGEDILAKSSSGETTNPNVSHRKRERGVRSYFALKIFLIAFTGHYVVRVTLKLTCCLIHQLKLWCVYLDFTILGLTVYRKTFLDSFCIQKCKENIANELFIATLCCDMKYVIGTLAWALRPRGDKQSGQLNSKAKVQKSRVRCISLNNKRILIA